MQDTDGQFIGLTVGEDIAFALENDRIEQSEMFARVDAVAKEVDVKNLLRQSPNALSGGQKQRVSMAGVMVDDVDILLFDEPLANLDPATGKRAIALIDEIQKKKDTTILIIEHRLEDVLYREVDRIIVFGEGRIVADTTPDKLMTMDVLEKEGIREPLYVTALKHAGCQITEDTKPAMIDTLDASSYKDNVQRWFEKVELPVAEKKDKPLLEVKDLSFSYDGKKQILKDINFTLHEGEMISIVGKNGAGKTILSAGKRWAALSGRRFDKVVHQGTRRRDWTCDAESKPDD